VRALHYGRYGKDADSERMSPLFLGYETYVRGYAVESFTGDECSQSLSSARAECPEFDRLIGSRLAVINLELRVPLFGVEGLGLINMPFLPTEISPFIDAGLAWWGSDAIACSVFTNGGECPPQFEYQPSDPRITFDRNTTDRVPVISTGVSARMNILGYLILEAYYAYPFQRPERGGHWGFNISPGW
jgi:outer membrane protein assembly factor BamA